MAAGRPINLDKVLRSAWRRHGGKVDTVASIVRGALDAELERLRIQSINRKRK